MATEANDLIARVVDKCVDAVHVRAAGTLPWEIWPATATHRVTRLESPPFVTQRPSADQRGLPPPKGADSEPHRFYTHCIAGTVDLTSQIRDVTSRCERSGVIALAVSKGGSPCVAASTKECPSAA